MDRQAVQEVAERQDNPDQAEVDLSEMSRVRA